MKQLKPVSRGLLHVLLFVSLFGGGTLVQASALPHRFRGMAPVAASGSPLDSSAVDPIKPRAVPGALQVWLPLLILADTAVPTVAPPTATPTETPTSTSTRTPTALPSPNTVLLQSLVNPVDDSRVAGGGFYNADITSSLGKTANEPTNHFFLFENVTIAPSAAIHNAYLRLPLLGSNSGSVNLRIAAYDVGNAAAPLTLAEAQEREAQLTSEQVDWNQVGDGAFGEYISSPNLAGVIQVLVNRPDWTMGSSILLWVGENGSDAIASRVILNADCTGCTQRPLLEIDYYLPNFAPQPSADAYVTNAAVLLDVLQNDSDPDGDLLALVEVSNPQHGAATISGHRILYTPEAGYAGPDSLTYTVSDGHNHSAVATVNITVVSQPLRYSLSFAVDTSAAPDLYYKDLSYLVHTGSVTAYSVTADGVAIPATFDAVSGDLIITSPAHSFHLILENPTDRAGLAVRIAALKDNRKWAWSHGMDDNVNLRLQVDLLNAKGWQGTLYLIGKLIDDTRDEGWILDKPALTTLLNQGWALGNHTWDHECAEDALSNSGFVEGTIAGGYNRLMEIVSSSERPGYQLLGVAAPCFASAYDPYIAALRAEGASAVKFNESQGNPLMHIDAGATGYSQAGKTAVSVSSLTLKIGRDYGIESSAGQTIANLDWMAANTGPTRHFWYNTLAHGNAEATLQQVVEYAYSTYGPGGTNELWMAPATDIYSYLLMRDNAVLSEPIFALVEGEQP